MVRIEAFENPGDKLRPMRGLLLAPMNQYSRILFPYDKAGLLINLVSQVSRHVVKSLEVVFGLAVTLATPPDFRLEKY